MSSTQVKKVRKYRGSKTHGGGSMKKRRGAGSRGGRGRAGSGKRGDSKKPSYWKDATFGAGEKGFTSKSRSKVAAINISDVERQLAALVASGAASEKAGAYVIDMDKAGLNKLLGSGRVSTKLTITVKHASPLAIKKVEEAGGSVTVTAERKERKQKNLHAPKKEAKAKDADDDAEE